MRNFSTTPVRRRIQPISKEGLIRLLNGEAKLTAGDLPGDARIVDLLMDGTLVLESAEFEAIPYGAPLPALPPWSTK